MMRTVGLFVLTGLVHAGTIRSASAQDPSGVYGYIAFIDPATGAPSQIQYNPRTWRYDRVEVGPWRFAFGTSSEPLPVNRRATPYPDLR
jgi:hypothetical protein